MLRVVAHFDKKTFDVEMRSDGICECLLICAAQSLSLRHIEMRSIAFQCFPSNAVLLNFHTKVSIGSLLLDRFH